MQTFSSLFLKEGFCRYVAQPIDRIAYAFIWSSATVTVTLGLVQFYLTLFEHTSIERIFTASVPTSFDHVLSTPLVLILITTVILCLIAVYCIKRLVEKGGRQWKPAEETEQIWQKVLVG